jgi:hypothetical protein
MLTSGRKIKVFLSIKLILFEKRWWKKPSLINDIFFIIKKDIILSQLSLKESSFVNEG